MNVRTIAVGAIAGSAALTLVLSACSSSKTTGAGSGATPAQNSATAPAAAGMITLSNGLLVGPNGHTLYFNTVDTATAIKCTGACALQWPPLKAGTAGSGLDAAKFGTASRPDGTMQVTYFGHPLYYFASDSAMGDKKGNELKDEGGEWFATTPKQAADDKPGKDAGGGGSAPATSSSSAGGGYTY